MSTNNVAAPTIIAPEIDLSFGDVTDPYYVDGSQWYLSDTGNPAATINVSSVWQDYTGKGVRIAVIDDGVDYDHSELFKNADRSAGRNLVLHEQTGPNDGSVVDSADKHGTTVAGIIVADDDGNGVVGVAHDATFSSLRIGYGGDHNPQQIKDAFIDAKGFDVVNASWGYDGYFYDNFNDANSFNSYVNPFIEINEKLIDAVANGRAGLGTVFVVSAGNGRSSGQDTNYHGFTSSPLTIAVGGHGSGGYDATFSTPGATVLVSAAAQGVLTTDRTGAEGYNSTDTVSKSGTSYSAPIVSGVVSLMLEANPELGYRDVQEILSLSAKQNDPNDIGWAFNGADNWNGGGRHVNHKLGFGAVDAHNAVRLAEVWSQQATYNNRVEHVFASGAINATLDRNEASPFTTTVSVGSIDFDLDRVVVDLDLTHGMIGELYITLTSPSGTTSILINNPGNGAGFASSNIDEFQLSSVHFWDEDIVGDWTLSITDKDYNTTDGVQYTGIFGGWSLTFIGDAGSDGDTYYYSDEWSVFGSETGRQTVTDAAGIDTLNFAMASSGVVIDMAAGSSNTFLGNPINIAAGTIIENFIGGDGNDEVTGNGAANEIQGWRGDDNLSGNGGDDILEGGRGDDIIDGGLGYDIAVFSGLSANYTIVDNGDGSHTVTDNVGADGMDTVMGVEVLRFADIDKVLGSPGGGDFGPVDEPTVPPTPTHIGTSADRETITGDSGDNVLSGGGGNWDKLEGLDGNDTYIVTTNATIIRESNRSDVDTVYVDTDYFAMAPNLEVAILLDNGRDLDGSYLDDVVTGNSADNVLNLDAGNDFADAGDGDDTVSPGDGNDFVDGGAGIDTVVFDGVMSDYLIEEHSNGVLTVLDFVGQGGLNQLVRVEWLQFADQTVAAADAIADPVPGSAAPVFAHPAGYVPPAPTISGTLGGGETIQGSNTADDVLFDGGGVWDWMVGGSGDDTYIISNASTRIGENSNEGTDTAVVYADDITITASIEVIYMMYGAISLTGSSNGDEIYGNRHRNIIDGSDGADLIFGYGGNDKLSGGDGSDQISGGDGDDEIDGGDGVDIAIFNGNLADYTVTEASNGSVTVVALSGLEGTDVLTGIEQLRFADQDYTVGMGGTIGPIDQSRPVINVPTPTHIGTAIGSETIIGTSGNDVLATGGGNWDKLEGGDGDDAYIITNDRPVIVREAPRGGVDTVYTSATFTQLAWGTEIIYLIDTASDVNGNDQTNYIDGNDFGNIIDALGDNDTILGWGGDDTITGGQGNDFIDGGSGDADTARFAGALSDYLIKEQADGTLTVTDLVGADGTDRLVRVENLQFADATIIAPDAVTDPAVGTDIDRLPGLDGIQAPDPTKSGTMVDFEYINGTAGDDVLFGGGGNADALFGDMGDDSFIIESETTRIMEHYDKGNDTAYIFAAHYVSEKNVETFHMMYGSLTLETASDANTITGNEFDNIIAGNGGGDTIDAGGGTDTVILNGDFADFDVTYSGSDTTIFVAHTTDTQYGVTTLTDVELLQFDDQVVSVDSFGFFI